MSVEHTSGSFSDTIVARLLALAISALCAYIIYSSYSDELKTLFSGKQTTGLPETTLETTPEAAANPELAACLQQRIGDVDRMREEGILTDEKYAAFRSRAEELCIQQNS